MFIQQNPEGDFLRVARQYRRFSNENSIAEYAIGLVTSGSTVRFFMPFDIQMRIIPILTWGGLASIYLPNSPVLALGTLSLIRQSITSSMFILEATFSGTAYFDNITVYLVNHNNAQGWLAFDSRL